MSTEVAFLHEKLQHEVVKLFKENDSISYVLWVYRESKSYLAQSICKSCNYWKITNIELDDHVVQSVV